MRPLRALSFRRVTLPSIADIQWAKQQRIARHMPRRHYRALYFRRLLVSLPPLLARLEMIATTPKRRRKRNA